MVYIPILGSLALAAGTILEKTILKNKKIGVKLYQTVSFFSIMLVMVPFLFFFWALDSQALSLNNILIFIAVVAASVTANLFIFYSLKWEKITNLEPTRLLEPIFVILLALILSFLFDGVYERDSQIIIPALIAAGALIFPHIRKEHLKLNKYLLAGVLGSFFFAVELVLSRLILDFYSPITFYFLRCSAIFLISLVIFRPKFKPLNQKISLTILITGAIWVVYRIAIYFGYLTYGITFTTLIIMLGPIFVYLMAWKFLKEKLSWKNIISSFIILACIIYVLLF